MEEDHPGRELDKGKRKAFGEDEEENRVLKQLKKTQANISVWALLISSRNQRQAILDALNRFETPIETTLEELVPIFNTQSQKP